MKRTRRKRRADTPWLVAALVLVLIAAGLAVFAFWPDGSPPGAGNLPVATTTAPATATTMPVGPDPVATSVPVPSSTSLSTTTTEPPPTPPLAFDTGLAMEHIRALATVIGVRPSGSEAENAAVSYAADYLAGLGYSVVVTDVPLPNGKTSHNVRAVRPGSSPWVLTLGGHLDSKTTTPGGNDNASGVAVVLELARDLVDADITPTVEFVLFGAEEIIGSDKNHHHYGSRRYVEDMTEQQRAALAGMVSVDMVGYGQELTIRNMGRGPQLLTDLLLASAAERGISSSYSRDTGPTGWSDHEAFEDAGYPVAWLEWQDDPTYHKAGDTYEHCDSEVVRQSGEMLLDFLAGLSEAALASLAEVRTLE
jgi:aminopeptidase YwaD